VEFEELNERVTKSIESFLEIEAELLIQDAKEESITTQLKKYLENEFKDWSWKIDHQYDKRIIENQVVQKRTLFARDSLPKDKIPKSISQDLKIINKKIMPDIIFHDRHSDKHNFLVIEVKLSTNKNKDDRIFDSLKLAVMTSVDLRYEWGIFIDFTSGNEFNPENPYQMKFVRNGIWQE
jgi:hypothetical protein